MNEIKNVVIVGLGAIGTLFASKIQDCKDVNLVALVDNDRKSRYIKNGILFNGKRYDFNYVLPDNVNNIKADLIIIATKSYGLNKAIEMIAKFVDKNTIIMSQLNGITSEDIIAKVYGTDKVLYSMMLGHISTRIENSITHDGNATIFFGEKNNNCNSEKVLRTKSLFEKAEITYKTPTDIMYTMWQKLMANVGFNQVTALTRADYSVLKKRGKTTELAIKLMNEVACVAKAVGIKNTEKMLPGCLQIIEQMPADAKSSMLQDVEANRQLEVDLFAGTICSIAKEYIVATPYNCMMLEILTAINERIQS